MLSMYIRIMVPLASQNAMTVLYMAFIISWKVLGELHMPKNITNGSKNPNLVLKAAFH
jgi:hypothetical protein